MCYVQLQISFEDEGKEETLLVWVHFEDEQTKEYAEIDYWDPILLDLQEHLDRSIEDPESQIEVVKMQTEKPDVDNILETLD